MKIRIKIISFINFLTKLLWLVLGFYALVIGILALAGCSGEVGIKASGTATVKHVVTIEFGVCDSLPEPADRIECVKALLEILEEVASERTNEGSK